MVFPAGGRGRRRVRIAFVTLVAVGAISLAVRHQFNRRHREQWVASVESLGLRTDVMSVSDWSNRQAVPLPPVLLPDEVVIVHLATPSEATTMLAAPEDCPGNLKIYAPGSISRVQHTRLEERFPTATLFTRIDL